VILGNQKGNQIIEHADGGISIISVDGTTVWVSPDSEAVIATAKGGAVVVDKNATTMLSKSGAYVSVQDSIVDVVNASTIKFSAPQIVLNTTATNGILLGQGATTGVAKADGVVAYLNVLHGWISAIMTWAVAHVHTSANPGMPTSPPVSPAPPANAGPPDGSPGGPIVSDKAKVI
jgi:hypothetical protein